MILNYKKTGSGPYLLLIHGLFGSLENLSVIAKALSNNFTVVNVDVRNHGNSEHEINMDYKLMASDIITVLDHLQIPSAHLVGHSMGGKIAMQVALDFSTRVNKLVVLDIAPVKYPARHNHIINALKETEKAKVTSRSEARNIMDKTILEPGITQFLLKSLINSQSEYYTWKFNLTSISQNYENITAGLNAEHSFGGDTLFIKGQNSDYVLPEYSEQIQKLFINVKAKIIHGAGHWLHAEKPSAVNRTILEFLI